MRIIGILTSVFMWGMVLTANADCTSIDDGDWGDPDTWDCGREPTSSETVTITAGHTITVEAQYGEYSDLDLKVYGTLDFDNGKKLDLDASCTVDVFDGGDVSGGNNGSKLFVGETTWTGADPPLAGPSFITEAGIVEGATLPVEFTQFNSTSEFGKVKLIWSTATEKNNDRFEIERSTNGLDFEFVGQVEGAGTTSEAVSYEFIDESPIIGFAYYRLKQIDFDGSYDYSEAIGVELSENADGSCTVKIIPNPCTPSCDIQYSACASTATNLDLQVYDTKGRLIHSYLSTSELSQGRTFRVNSTDFAMPGVYIVKAGRASDRMVIK